MLVGDELRKTKAILEETGIKYDVEAMDNLIAKMDERTIAAIDKKNKEKEREIYMDKIMKELEEERKAKKQDLSNGKERYEAIKKQMVGMFTPDKEGE